MIEFDMDGGHYRLEKPNAMQQLHLSRKLAPLLPALAPVVDRMLQELRGKNSGEFAKVIEGKLLDLAQLAQPFADQLANMKDEDAEYVFDLCLGCTWVQHDGNWIKFWVKGAKMPSVKELNDPSIMIKLVLRVIRESLGNFITGFATNVQEPASAA